MNKKLALSVAIIAIFLPIGANAGWSITSLETPTGFSSYPASLNNSGQVAGVYGGSEFITGSFITGPNGVGFIDLGTLTGTGIVPYASDINDLGQVVGSSGGSGPLPIFITGPNGSGMSSIGLGGSAYGINNTGQVVGTTYFAGGPLYPHAFITGSNGLGASDLGTLGGKYSSAYGINNSGQVVGFSSILGEMATHAFITEPEGVGMTDLGTLGGKDSYAYKINDSGQVAGSSNAADGYLHAFITGHNGTGMIDLGAMGADVSSAYSINNLGQAVGVAYFDCNCPRASFVYSDGVMVNISTLDVVAASGWTDIRAFDINDNGQIAGYGFLHGVPRAFLLSGADDKEFFRNYVETPIAIPEPSTYALMLAGLGVLGFMGRKFHQDR